MDICLNVVTEPAIGRSKKKLRNKSFKTSIKRLKNQPLQSGTVVNNNESKRNVNAQEVKPQKRVKQKSLATIFAKNLQKGNTITDNVQKHSKHPLRDKDKPTTKAKEIKQSNIMIKEDSKSDSISCILDTDTSKPFVSFTKIRKEHVGETLLAKKRNISNSEQKLLSAIFSTQLTKQDESNILTTSQEHSVNKNDIANEEVEIVDTELSLSHDTKVLGSRKIKGKKYKEKIINRTDKESDETTKLMHRHSGKISSLFGNNPDVPNIGQRFVKPVNEPVFTEINFADLDIHSFTISNLKQNMCITKMTTVQQKAIPQIFSGRDILIRSQTGSGKTLAYALPIVELLHKIRPKLSRNSGLSALVIVPTRELALQTYECFIKLIKPFTWIVPGYLTGGEKRKAEKARLRKGCNILVATPGRLLDHVKHTAALRLHEVKYFVLDEADRMLDMGYEKDISGIVSALKVSSSDSDESGYDPMKILKQNSKRIITDEEIDAQVEEISKGDNTESDDKPAKDNVKSTKEKKMYHSSNNDTDSFKKGNKDAKHPDSDANVQNSMIKRENVSHTRRQTILLSATLTHAVEKLAGLAMQNPIFVDAAKENLEVSGGDINEINEDLIVPQSVYQTYIVTPPKLRMVTLSAYIAGRCQIAGGHKMLIFMATQDMIDYHTKILSSVLTKPTLDEDEDSDPLVDVEFFKLHGSMTQKERTEIFRTFRQAKSGVLLCTDVAARGLDMPKVDCVVQYTGPISARDYVHRIGRTARAGSSGTATIFLTPAEIEFVRLLESRRIRIKQEDMNDVLDKLLGPLSKHCSVQAAAITLQNNFENLLLENRGLSAKAYKAYLSWMRFYSSYPRDMREIFNWKALHLGHYAKSFALRDTPQRIGGIGKKLREEESSRTKHNNRLSNKQSDGVPQKEQKDQDGGRQRTGLLKRVRMLNVSEYGSGLEPLKKSKK